MGTGRDIAPASVAGVGGCARCSRIKVCTRKDSYSSCLLGNAQSNVVPYFIGEFRIINADVVVFEDSGGKNKKASAREINKVKFSGLEDQNVLEL